MVACLLRSVQVKGFKFVDAARMIKRVPRAPIAEETASATLAQQAATSAAFKVNRGDAKLCKLGEERGPMVYPFDCWLPDV